MLNCVYSFILFNISMSYKKRKLKRIRFFLRLFSFSFLLVHRFNSILELKKSFRSIFFFSFVFFFYMKRKIFNLNEELYLQKKEEVTFNVRLRIKKLELSLMHRHYQQHHHYHYTITMNSNNQKIVTIITTITMIHIFSKSILPGSITFLQKNVNKYFFSASFIL